MAKKKASAILKSLKVFINENDEAIEKEAYINADTIESEMKTKENYLKVAHLNIIEALEITNTNDSKYFDFDVFEEMIKEKVETRKERREKAEERKRKAEEKEKSREE